LNESTGSPEEEPEALVEDLFCELVARRERVSGDEIGELGSAQPDLAAHLRAIFADWVAGRNAIALVAGRGGREPS